MIYTGTNAQKGYCLKTQIISYQRHWKTKIISVNVTIINTIIIIFIYYYNYYYYHC